MSTQTEPTKARRVQVTTEIQVVIEPHYMLLWGVESPEERMKALERWAEQLREFFRDHRHQDVNSVSVVPKTADVCSACGHNWETERYDDEGEDGLIHCMGCGRVVENQS